MGQTITLTSGELDITDAAKPLYIVGPGANQLTIKASNSYSGPVFDVASTATASILGVTITKGYNEAVYNAGNLSLTNCTISYVTGGTSLYGINFDGHWGGSLVVNGCSIQNNGDAGIHFDGSGGGALTVTNSNLSGNYQGLNIGAGTSTITSCTISGNSNDGVYFQGYMGNPGVMTITNTTISGNSLSGIDDWGATLTINDSTIADNGQNASFGGGIYDDGGTLVANDCTIARNSASGGGGGIYQESGTTSTLNNTIVAGNMNGTSPDIYRAVTANHCLIGDNTGSGLAAAPVGTPDANGNMIGTHTSPIDPMLDPNGLNSNGGPTQTILLLAGSPAIDHGSNALAQAAGVVADQRGLYRVYPANGTVDIGACEYQPDPSTQDALVHQVLRLSPATFDGAGNDVTLTLGDVVTGQQVTVYVGQSPQDLRPITGTFVNTAGDLPWTFSVDLAAANAPLAEAEYVAVGSDKPVIILSAVGLHPNLTDLLSAGYQQCPAAAGSQPDPTTTDYSQVAQLYKWDGSTFQFFQQSDWPSLDWSKPTIILTHGWTGKIPEGDSDRTADYIWTFAQTITDASAYNILAVDWYDNGQNDGSDPENIALNSQTIAQALADKTRFNALVADARQSAQNGIGAAAALADRLVSEVGQNIINPQDMMLIGHSNGAGFVASLAIELKNKTGENVSEMDTLDAPAATAAWGEVECEPDRSIIFGTTTCPTCQS